LERLDLDDSLIPNQHLANPGSSELSYTSSLASAPERMMLLTTQGEDTIEKLISSHHASQSSYQDEGFMKRVRLLAPLHEQWAQHHRLLPYDRL